MERLIDCVELYQYHRGEELTDHQGDNIDHRGEIHWRYTILIARRTSHTHRTHHWHRTATWLCRLRSRPTFLHGPRAPAHQPRPCSSALLRTSVTALPCGARARSHGASSSARHELHTAVTIARHRPRERPRACPHWNEAHRENGPATRGAAHAQ